MDKSGITIINNDGNIVLNDTFVNMELLRIVPCKSMTGDSTVALREMFQDNELLAFVWNNSGGNMVAAITTNSNKGKVDLVISTDNTDGSGDDGYYTDDDLRNFFKDYYVAFYGFRTRKSDSNYGLEIYDSKGNKIFNSERKYLNIIYQSQRYIYKNDVDENNKSINVSLDPKRLYGVCCLNYVGYDYAEEGTWEEGGYYPIIVNNKCQWSSFWWDGFTGILDEKWSFAYDSGCYFLIADVTAIRQ